MAGNLSGNIAKAFIKSKLTPLLVIASILLGVFAVAVTPREEEPQIIVPMIDVFVSYPGASAKEVEERVTTPMESLIWEIKGVEYVYSMASPGMNLTIVRFKVGSDMEESIVKLYNKLMSNYDRIPPGVSQPLVKPRSIDDVPVLALTLWSERYSGYELRQTALELARKIKEGNDISEVSVIGGQKRQVLVELDAGRLNAYSITPGEVIGSLQRANANLRAGSFEHSGRVFNMEAGGFLKSAKDAGTLVVGTSANRPVYLENVANITDGPEEPANHVFMGFGPAGNGKGAGASNMNAQMEAVTLAISKKEGANASVVAEEILEKAEGLKGALIPGGINFTVTRNYGDTAKEKSDELLKHMMIATIAVIALIALALGWRESIVVAVAVPVTLALTLLINYLYGYTLNRVTLFALIFSIGILVDDAIVVVENIHRRFSMDGASPESAIAAVNEVGNPTILATFTVIAALLPMAFVSGLMGPYMRPIPVGASVAMIFSLLVAFIVSPWMSSKVLKNVHEGNADEEGFIYRSYMRLAAPLFESRRKRALALAAIGLLLLLAFALIPLKKVIVKMLPFDNKSEAQIIIEMPEGSTLETTAALAREMGEYLRTVPEVAHFQSYIGTASPYNFNGLVRHYYLRSAPHMADIQVNFSHKRERSSQSHDIAKRLRPELEKIAGRFNAEIKVAEVPPGPPVLSTLVAEVYGPDEAGRIELAGKIKKIFEETQGVVDVDWYVEDRQDKVSVIVDREKAALSGVDANAIAQAVSAVMGGASAGLMHSEESREPVEIFLRAPVSQRAGLKALDEINMKTPDGAVPLSSLVKIIRLDEDRTIYHKNLKNVTYVTGDLAGEAESPVYAILKMKEDISKIRDYGYEIKQYTAAQPQLDNAYAVKWDGEWHITYEVFRDLSIAFAAVLVLIYVLVVAWFRSFLIPLIIMAPIPLTLAGVLPGHWLMGSFFTATSMIGFIALAGIIVRNSILLVDFIGMERAAGADARTAALRAGAIRLRPIVLTALAVVIGSFVMLFDPIFQGLAISMMFGAVAATVLTLLAVPLIYYEFYGEKG